MFRSVALVAVLATIPGTSDASLTAILQTDFDLNKNGTKESFVKSFGDVALICSPCTIHSVFQNELDTAQDIEWQTQVRLTATKVVPGATLLKGTAPAAKPISSEWNTYRAVNPVAITEPEVHVVFPTAKVDGPAAYYEWPVSIAQKTEETYDDLKFFYDKIKPGTGRALRSKIIDSLWSLEFGSSYDKLEDGRFQYTLSVTNENDTLVAFDWVRAGFAGTVEGHRTVTQSVVLDALPLEDFSQGMATIQGRQYEVPAMFWASVAAPVPEPASWLCFGAGLSLIAILGRRRSARQV